MKSTITIFSIAVYLLLWGGSVSFSQDEHSRIFREDKAYPYTSTSYIDSAGLDSFIVGQMAQNHIPGVSACIVKKGQIIWTGNYGWAYINNVPIYDSTLFQIASISKTVMATAMMKLYERGWFELDDSINAYLPFTVRNPFYPDSAITFRMLMTHTSSIRDNWSLMPLFHLDPPLSLRDYLDDYFTPDSMYYSQENFYNIPPGSNYNYSNIGAALAGYLVEAISGIDFNEYCKDSIFTPLGMNESSFFYRDLDTMHIAMPYRYIGNYVPFGHYGYCDYPDGMLKTSTIQLARFLIAYMQYGRLGNVRILDSATVRLILTPQIPLINSVQGLIWQKLNQGEREVWGHGGSDFGIRTRMFFCPNDTTGVLLFTNGTYDILAPIVIQMFNYASAYVTSIYSISSRIPSDFKLFQNYPNPFNPQTKIKFDLPDQSQVKLVIYDILGREIATLVNEQLQPGSYEVDWNALNYSSGVYFYKLITAEFTETKRMVLIK